MRLVTKSLSFSALTLLVRRQEGPPCKKTEWWGAAYMRFFYFFSFSVFHFLAVGFRAVD